MLDGLFRAEDDRRGHSYHTPPFPAFDDLSIVQVGRWEELGCGLRTAFAREVQEDLWHARDLQQGVGRVRQLITGKAWNRATSNSAQTLQQQRGVFLCTFTHHQGGYQAPCRCKSDPHP